MVEAAAGMPAPPIAELGQLSVAVALGLSLLAVLASGLGIRRDDAALIETGRRAMLACAFASSVAMGLLTLAFLTHDFSLRFVWQTSSTLTPLMYRLTGVWGGQAGSLLYWSWLMAIQGALALLLRWRADSALMPAFTAVTAGVTAFFLYLSAFVASPFERLVVQDQMVRLAEGNGLNPLLQHPGMAFHPPALYLGFTGMTIPFAFAMAALISRRTDAGWILASRRWMLVAWAALSLGLSLGGRWAYDVLGWGGYWAWDPVENAAFMPWLSATAFLHSVMIQERRGTFKVWNMALIILTFGLVIVGTFLTRAGLVSSVHAFAQSDIGPYFLVYTAVVLIGSVALLFWRLPDLQSDTRIEHPLSREGAFMANNLLFMGALFAVFWGTLFPLFSEIFSGQRVTVGEPYFNRVVMPIFGLLVLLMAVGPLIGWHQADGSRLRSLLLRPAIATLLVVLGLAILGVRKPVALIGFGVSGFALLITLLEIGRGLRARMRGGEPALIALRQLFSRGRRRYGGYLVHIGIAVLGIGVIGSSVYQIEMDKTLSRGEQVEIGGYVLRYEGLRSETLDDRERVVGALAVERGGRSLPSLIPRKDFYFLQPDQPVTVPSVYSRRGEDLYALLGSYDEGSQQATFKLFVNPLVGYVWLGMLILVAGTLFAAWPSGQESRVLDAELARLLSGSSAGSGAGVAAD